MEELDLKELFTMFWSKKLYIIVITIIVMLIGVVYSYFFITPEYKSSTTLVLEQSTSTTTLAQDEDLAITATDLTMNSKLVSTYSELIKTNAILSQVATNLNVSPEVINKMKNKFII